MNFEQIIEEMAARRAAHTAATGALVDRALLVAMADIAEGTSHTARLMRFKKRVEALCVYWNLRELLSWQDKWIADAAKAELLAQAVAGAT